MGISYHPALPAAEARGLPILSFRMARLFNEFLDRYIAWQGAKRQARFWTLILIFLGAVILALPYYFAVRGFILSAVLFAGFYFAVCRCLEASGRASHLAVNVNILYHHLAGKLEAGFCEHGSRCRCVEVFRLYVAKEYHIDFNKGSV